MYRFYVDIPKPQSQVAQCVQIASQVFVFETNVEGSRRWLCLALQSHAALKLGVRNFLMHGDVVRDR